MFLTGLLLGVNLCFGQVHKTGSFSVTDSGFFIGLILFLSTNQQQYHRIKGMIKRAQLSNIMSSFSHALVGHQEEHPARKKFSDGVLA